MTITVATAEGTATGAVGGALPVQGDGVVQRAGCAELHWYFRARGDAWTLDVGEGEDTDLGWYVDDDDAVWSAGGDWGPPGGEEAGWMEHEIAAEIVRDALTRYLRGEPRWEAPADLHQEAAP